MSVVKPENCRNPEFVNTFSVAYRGGENGTCSIEFYTIYGNPTFTIDDNGNIVGAERHDACTQVSSVIMTTDTLKKLYNLLGKVMSEEEKDKADSAFMHKFMGNSGGNNSN